MTYTELFKTCTEMLEKAGIDEAQSDVRLLFSYMLDADRGFMFMHGDDSVDDDLARKVTDACTVRCKRVPLQHITGYQNFMGLEFKVTADVLVPRFDTECLVEEAMLVCGDGDKVLDVCTGSGCILISLMKYKNDIKGFGCDISEAALNVAKENAASLLGTKKVNKPLCELGMSVSRGVGSDDEMNCGGEMNSGDGMCSGDGMGSVDWVNSGDWVNSSVGPEFIKSDLFSEITEKDFDIIVSNPPYIRSDVIKTLMPEVKDHDPMLALDGGEDGLIFYRRIAEDAKEFLRKGGRLLVEIGHDQGEDVKKLFVENGYSDVSVVKDLAGNDRVVKGVKG